jgi:hypothetical protein
MDARHSEAPRAVVPKACMCNMALVGRSDRHGGCEKPSTVIVMK